MTSLQKHRIFVFINHGTDMVYLVNESLRSVVGECDFNPRAYVESLERAKDVHNVEYVVVPTHIFEVSAHDYSAEWGGFCFFDFSDDDPVSKRFVDLLMQVVDNYSSLELVSL